MTTMTPLRHALLRLSAGSARVTALLAMALGGHPWARMLPNPFLQNGFAPVRDELSVHDLPVRGRLPEGLDGIYLRNGPNPAYKPISYMFPFDGDGMVHALRFRDGRAEYRNRYIVTPGLRAERRAGRAIYGGVLAPHAPDPALLQPGDDPNPFKNTANTNIVSHAGRLLALWEGGPPTELDAELKTRGPYDFNGKLPHAMTAHPRIDPVTGEMLAFRYGVEPPYLVFSVIDRDGHVVRQVPLDLDTGFMVHDFAVTARHAVFFLGPVVLNLQNALNGGRLLEWQPARGTRIAVLPRDADGPVQWFDADPFFVFHFMNAHEDNGHITVDYIQHAGFGNPTGGVPCLWRMDLDLATGAARRTQLTERSAEFPRIDPAIEGRPNRYGWSPVRGGLRGAPATFSALAHYDLQTGDMTVRDFGPGQEVDEPVFIPRPGTTREGDGWIGAYVYDRTEDASRFVLLDALDLPAPPVAEVLLPRRVPHGFHGNWVAA